MEPLSVVVLAYCTQVARECDVSPFRMSRHFSPRVFPVVLAPNRLCAVLAAEAEAVSVTPEGAVQVNVVDVVAVGVQVMLFAAWINPVIVNEFPLPANPLLVPPVMVPV